MRTPLRPIDIEFLLWCHLRPGSAPTGKAPAFRESARMWLGAGMIQSIEDGAEDVFATTSKGVALVKALCNVQFDPEVVESDPAETEVPYSERELIHRAISNARPLTRAAPRWAAVKQAFGTGSQVSWAICKSTVSTRRRWSQNG